MRRRRAASSGQNKSGRSPSARSFTGWDEGADDTFDDAPDDLPVRDVRDDEGEPRSSHEVSSERLAKPEAQSADGRVVQADPKSGLREPQELPLLSSVHNGRLGDDLQSSPPLSEAEAGEPPPQHLLPGLEPDATASPGGARSQAERSSRRRSRSQKLTFKAAQLELWPEAESGTSGD